MENKIIILIFSMLLMGGCNTSRQTVADTETKKVQYSVQLSSSRGGIVENTRMEDVTGAGVDAFSGATRRGISAGARVALPVGRHFLEAGVDYMYSGQTFTFNDVQNQFTGKRKLGTHQIMFPTTFNLSLFTQNHPNGLLQIKLGHLLQLNNVSVRNETGSLPGYHLTPWSNGFLFGIHLIPVRLINGARMGLFIEGYRGSQIYQDHYNQKNFEMPGTAFSRVGVIYHF